MAINGASAHRLCLEWREGLMREAITGNHRHSETITLSGFIRHALSGFIGMLTGPQSTDTRPGVAVGRR